MRAKFWPLLLFGVLSAGNDASWAQARLPLEKMRFVYSAIGGSQSSVWIPYEAGIFRKHGLDIELLYVGAGGRLRSCNREKSRWGFSPAAPW